MKRRFVASTEALTPAQETELKAQIGAVHWWHWLPNTWLIVDYTGNVTAGALRDAIRKVNGGTQCLVIEVTPVTWASMERQTPHGALSDWVQSTFMPD